VEVNDRFAGGGLNFVAPGREFERRRSVTDRLRFCRGPSQWCLSSHQFRLRPVGHLEKGLLRLFVLLLSASAGFVKNIFHFAQISFQDPEFGLFRPIGEMQRTIITLVGDAVSIVSNVKVVCVLRRLKHFVFFSSAQQPAHTVSVFEAF
jgi:hypothetical protein